jgi:hypothetical protein
MSSRSSSPTTSSTIRRSPTGARGLYRALREAFPDFHAVVHWQTADGEIVTTFKTYHGTHRGTFVGVAPTGRNIHGETVDAMRVHNGNITEHWGVANLSLTSSPSSGVLAAPAFPERSAGGNCTITTQGLKMSNNVRQIPLGSGLRKVERSDGEAFDVAGVRFTWKVKGEDTGYAFSIYEQKLEPGEGVPLHCHAYGEVFMRSPETSTFSG